MATQTKDDIFQKYILAQQDFDSASASESEANERIRAATEERKKWGKRKEEALNKLNAAKAELIASL